MGRRTPSLFFWFGTLCSFLFAAFLCVFALDVFDEKSSVSKTIVALLIHLIPAAIVVVALAITWWKESLGAAIFFMLGVTYIVMTWDRVHWSAQGVISGPLFVIGVLFFLDWLVRWGPQQPEPGIG